MNTLIPDPTNFSELKNRFIYGGKENLHVLADFDRTLTCAYDEKGNSLPSTIGQLRHNDCLTPDYGSRAFALLNKYRPLEMDPYLSREEKTEKMLEWWSAHEQLLIECGLSKFIIQEIVAKKTLKFRTGAEEFFSLLDKNNIPLIIMSAGPGDIIAEYLKQAGLLSNNVHIIANWYEFDDNGKMIGVKKPRIHSLNKYEITVSDYPVFNFVKNKKNVILLGDGIDDIGMIEGFDCDNLMKIGFLNDETDKYIDAFKKNFDLIILNDDGMDSINEIITQI